jgi:PAS domain S-box-containing protein
MRQSVWVMIVAMLFGLGFWLIDSVYEYFMFSENLRFMLFQEPLNFWDSLVLNVPTHALINRLSFMAACLLGGGLVAWALAKRRRSEMRYRTYVRNAPHGILVVDLEGKIVEANQAASEIAGREAEFLVGRDLAELIQPEDVATFTDMRARLESDPRADTEVTLRVSQGRTVDAAISATRINPSRYILFIRDITEANRMADRLRQSQKLESIGQLAGGIAHDFNNLLTGIQGNAQLLRMEMSSETPHSEYCDDIVQAAMRGSDLTRKLLNFARREKFATVNVDIHQIIQEVCDLLRHSIDRRIEIELSLRANRATVAGDPSQLQNALLNLGLNARDAMTDGGKLVYATREMHVGPDEDHVAGDQLSPGTYIEVDVSDDGVGMTEEIRRRIFDPFFTTKEPGRGTGLGLAGVYGTVRGHGGAVTVYSRPGHGTTMKVFLPTTTDQAEVSASTAPEPTEFAGRGRILIADDEDLVRNFAAEVLQQMGYEVRTASDGPSALSTADQGAFDLFLIDLIMPRMSGMEVLRRLRRKHPDIPVVVTSGFSAQMAWEDLEAEGAGHFLAKPFGMSDLVSMLLKAVPDSLDRRD